LFTGRRERGRALPALGRLATHWHHVYSAARWARGSHHVRARFHCHQCIDALGMRTASFGEPKWHGKCDSNRANRLPGSRLGPRLAPIGDLQGNSDFLAPKPAFAV
jgi:hypothetical protein